MSDEPIEFLVQQRDKTLSEIKKAVPDLYRRLEAWNQAIEACQAKGIRVPGDYAGTRSGLEAMEMYLEQAGPQPRKDACREVARLGWDKGDENAFWKLLDVVRAQLDKQSNQRIILLGEDIIGLPSHKKTARTK
jgi:hypothetical protein